MNAPHMTAWNRELLKNLMEKDWRPHRSQPDDYGDYSALVSSVWDAWHRAELEEPGTGYVAARAAFEMSDQDGRYSHLLSDKPDALPVHEEYYKARHYVIVLSQLGYSFALNECDDRVEVNGDLLTDVLEAVIRTELRDRGLKNLSRARDAYIAEAKRNSYHPVKRYLEGLAWDGQDHIKAMAACFQDRHGKFPLYFRRWVIGAVAKVYEEAQNRMLVLDGPQDLGKSYWTRWLSSPLADFFVESPVDPNNKDHHIRLIRNWIWEVGEVGSTTRRTDREALKYFLTIRLVTVRKPYDRHDVVKPALASFIGTVNNDSGFLNDPTGSRRFMVTTVDRIDWSYTSLDVNQIWAQAYNLYRGGETWHLSSEESASASEINAEYEVENPLDDLLRIHFEIDPTRGDWKLTTVRTLDHLHSHANWHLDNPTVEAAELSSALKKLGAVKKLVKDPKTGARLNGYVGIRTRN